ncbi:electron transfer flavoprotein beta subunit lysine methyltransferase [Halyomorpha halys]|uniref:electron transfer flavoprotein beta subunit lysine methyltransferase n=1 Tax=Halyomorpha halys TaxID=286706 RepID=UPI0006D4EE7D|nr:electron transfer flavoprotein beta subunit lysine methyltransferase-like [Halyomorpha halys]
MRYLFNLNTTFGHRVLLRSLIRKCTEVSDNHMTPEIKLHLITPSCSLWHSNIDKCIFVDPYWGFYWAGGQALSRYILDNKKIFKGKNVIDIGSGSGACAIAAACCEDVTVIANDIDPVACEVISMNSRLNNVKIHLNNENLLLSSGLTKVDIILIGDLFYDSEFGEVLFQWLLKCRKNYIKILIGDPGRYVLDNTKKKQLSLVKEYSLSENIILENCGFSSAYVWQM